MLERELYAALSWVYVTDEVALAHQGLPAEEKADGTPVTPGDRAVEAALRSYIAKTFPKDDVLGEEEGGDALGERVWIIDPIDGTKNYMTNIPVYATLLALQVGGVTEVAVISAPALQARWWAIRGGGAFRDGMPIGVSTIAEMAQARLCHGGLDWNTTVTSALASVTKRARGFGDFWGYCLVAEGSMDLMYEAAPLARWDLAAPRLLVEQAGGLVTAADGTPDPHGGSVLASNGALHDAALGVIAAAG